LFSGIKRGDTMRLLQTIFFMGLVAALTARAVDPVVSNVRVAQRPGTGMLDITYDLTYHGDALFLVKVNW